jgi:hypothetical protein
MLLLVCAIAGLVVLILALWGVYSLIADPLFGGPNPMHTWSGQEFERWLVQSGVILFVFVVLLRGTIRLARGASTTSK